MRTAAHIVGRTKAHVMVRIPDLHPHRILTLPAVSLRGGRGETATVDCHDGLVYPDMPAWWRDRRWGGECPCVDCAAESRAAWRMFCRDVWRVLGLDEPNTRGG